jgi:hypothetical protein
MLIKNLVNTSFKRAAGIIANVIQKLMFFAFVSIVKLDG